MSKWKWLQSCLLFSGLVLPVKSVFAVSVLPGAALPEQVSRALSERLPNLPKFKPNLKTEESKKIQPLGEAGKKIQFKLKQVVLKGNTKYSAKELEPLYSMFLNKTIPVANIFSIAEAITNYYRDHGYILVRVIVPPQKVKDGILHLQVIEGYVDQVRVSGNPGRAQYRVQVYGDQIKKSKPLSVSDLERYLLIANDIPATQTKAVINASKTQVGAADLDLVTTHKPFSAYLSYDNSGSRYIGRQVITANVSANSAIRSGDRIQLMGSKTPKGKELSSGDVSYDTPIGSEGLRATVGYTVTNTLPAFLLYDLKVSGLTRNYYVSLRYPLIRRRDTTLILNTGLEVGDSDVKLSDQPLYHDRLRVFTLGALYSFADRWHGSNSFYADVRQGLPIWGYTKDDNITAQTSRPGVTAKFTKFDFQAARWQSISGPWNAYGLIKGQYALNPLLTGEQFGFGGNLLGRAYEPSEILGDKGVAGSLELRYDWDIQRLKLSKVQWFGFYDAGATWYRKDITGRPNKFSATSTGFGSRLYFNKYLSGNLTFAKPLTNKIASEELTRNGKAPRILFSIVLSTD